MNRSCFSRLSIGFIRGNPFGSRGGRAPFVGSVAGSGEFCADGVTGPGVAGVETEDGEGW